MLAVLFRGLDDIDRGRLVASNEMSDDIESSSGMNRIAKKIQVQLGLDEKLGTTKLVVSEVNS